MTQSQVQEMRNAIKPMTEQIITIEKAVSRAKLAKKLGCNVEDLQKEEMECPADKISKVIGKKGATVKRIEETASVSLDIDADKHIIVINGGSPAAFAAAKEEITKIIMTKEEDVDVPSSLILYLATNKNITVLEELKAAHREVHFDVTRTNKKIPMRGLAEDIAKVKQSLISLNVVQQERELTSAEAMLVIGKKGATIDRITAQYKAAIDVEKKGDDKSLAIVAGPAAEVIAAMKEIEDLLDANKEVSKSIPCGKAIREALLNGGGARIKELQKKINESTKALNAGTVSLKFDKVSGDTSHIEIHCKNSAIGTAVAMVGDAIREIDSSTVRIVADKHVLPQIIGKGGENIKKMKDGKNINIEVDKKSGEISINGVDQAEVAEVERQVLAIIAENKVHKIPVDPAQVEHQYRELVRSKTRHEITELSIRLDLDKEESIILLRGTNEGVMKAAEMVKEFLDTNYIEAVEITDSDRDALLSGGKSSKIVNLAKELEVHLSVDKATSSIQVKGTAEKVKAAVKHINAYLFGGEGNICIKLAVADEALGIVIGKGGKNRKAMETKYAGVSIYIHRSKDAITIRGPEEPATNCRNEILKMIASARITQSVSVTEEQMAGLNKSNKIRQMTQHIPVQCTTEGTTVKVRGISNDVKDAVALLNEHLTGVYESTLELGTSQFAKIKAASRDESHFARMKDSTGAELSLDNSKNAVVIRGKKNNVKKCKFQVLDFLAFLVPGEFDKVKLPKALHATVGQAATLIDAAATTGASIALDRDLSMILIQSSEQGRVADAMKVVQAKVSDAQKLMYVFEFDTTDAWVIPILIGKGGDNVNSIRKKSGCNVEISKEERTVVVSGITEESVAKAKEAIQASIDKAKKETAFIDVPADAMPKFVGKGGAHIDSLRKKFEVEIETMKKGSSKVKITGEETKVLEAKEDIEKWVAEWSKPVESKHVQIQRHHISAIIGKNGANIQALQEEFGCKIDLDRENLKVSFRGDPAKQELALRKIEEIMAEIPSTPERASQPKSEEEPEQNSSSPSAEPTKKEENGDKSKGEKAISIDAEEKKDRTTEFPQLPIGVAPSKGKKRRKRKPQGAGGKMGSPAKSMGSPSWEESSVSDEDEKIVARDPAVDDSLTAHVGA